MASEKRIMLVFTEDGNVGLNMDDGIAVGMFALAAAILQREAFQRMDAQALAARAAAEQKPTRIERVATLPQALKKVQ